MDASLYNFLVTNNYISFIEIKNIIKYLHSLSC